MVEKVILLMALELELELELLGVLTIHNELKDPDRVLHGYGIIHFTSTQYLQLDCMVYNDESL